MPPTETFRDHRCSDFQNIFVIMVHETAGRLPGGQIIIKPQAIYQAVSTIQLLVIYLAASTIQLVVIYLAASTIQLLVIYLAVSTIQLLEKYLATSTIQLLAERIKPQVLYLATSTIQLHQAPRIKPQVDLADNTI